MIGMIFYIEDNEVIKFKKIVIAVFCNFILLLSLFLSGRTGFFVFGFGLIYYLIVSWAQGKKLHFKNILIVNFILFLIPVLILTYVVDFSDFERMINWFFEIFINVLEGNGATSASTDVLLNDMYFLPDGAMNLLFGTFNFGRSDYLPYINSDVGYVLFIYGAGLLGLFISFSLYGYFYIVSLNFKNDQRLSFILKFILFMVFIGNFKDEYYFSIDGITPILMIIVALIGFIKNKANIDSAFRLAH
jgi:hypothetical protein